MSQITELKEYELTIVSNLSDQYYTQDERIRAYYIIRRKDVGGWKRLPYPVTTEDGVVHEKGFYVYYELLARDNTEPYFLTRLLDKDQLVLRHLMVVKRPKRS